jgi:hypothetical protein
MLAQLAKWMMLTCRLCRAITSLEVLPGVENSTLVGRDRSKVLMLTGAIFSIDAISVRPVSFC